MLVYDVIISHVTSVRTFMGREYIAISSFLQLDRIGLKEADPSQSRLTIDPPRQVSEGIK